MYTYYMGTADWFYGMIPLKDYIKLCPDLDEGYSHIDMFNYLSRLSLRLFLLECFIHMYSQESYWEGDIRADNIYIGGIPRTNGNTPCKFIIFKQDNNGSTFLVSECEMPFKFDDGSFEPMNNYIAHKPKELVKITTRAYKFVDDFFRKYLSNSEKDTRSSSYKDESLDIDIVLQNKPSDEFQKIG